MRKQRHQSQINDVGIRKTLLDRLVYIPGALVLAYGFWLSLTA